ncbi:MAG: 3-isopropylmalate dehydratase small subunit [Gammaproteobacteria bacterium]|nr:MAG: 3-isopropylmalate dehydratase small subunit [Gammaproteobacteria bacterium]
MEKIVRIESPTLVLPQDDIDTDQIMPARYLTTTTKEGLGDAIFADWRYDADGRPIPDFPLNQPGAKDCKILVTGNNFGCGSSREHAPWGLVDFGFRAVISTQIADIFRNNALKNGLVPVVVDSETHAWLLANPGARLAVDVEQRRLELPDGRSVPFPLDGFSRLCLMEGIDQLGYLLKHEDAIRRFEETRPWQP